MHSGNNMFLDDPFDAAIIGGLIAGLSDRYFFSLDFHHSVTLFWLIVGLATAAVQMVIEQDRQSLEVTYEA